MSDRDGRVAGKVAVVSGASSGIGRATFELLGRVELGAEERDALRELRKTAFLSEDATEGRTAFKEKRAPRFSGR